MHPPHHLVGKLNTDHANCKLQDISKLLHCVLLQPCNYFMAHTCRHFDTIKGELFAISVQMQLRNNYPRYRALSPMSGFTTARMAVPLSQRHRVTSRVATRSLSILIDVIILIGGDANA